MIAVVFGVLVVRLAQLDIGFVRSATEFAVLELQGDYPRAHLTRYCALYTSLSTDYTLELSNPTAVGLPFATGSGPHGRPATAARHGRALAKSPTLARPAKCPFASSNWLCRAIRPAWFTRKKCTSWEVRCSWCALADDGEHRLRNGTRPETAQRGHYGPRHESRGRLVRGIPLCLGRHNSNRVPRPSSNCSAAVTASSSLHPTRKCTRSRRLLR